MFKEELMTSLGMFEYTRLAGLAQDDDSQESAASDGAIVSTTGKLGPITGGAVSTGVLWRQTAKLVRWVASDKRRSDGWISCAYE